MSKLLTKDELKRVSNIEKEIEEIGFTGKPLGFNFFREKKISEKRIYFLVYEEINAALMVSISGKKQQQETIDKIREFLPEFKELMEKMVKST